MNQFSCLIVDDEPLAIKILERYCAKIQQIQHLGSYTSPLEAMQVLQKQQVDVLLLDINMPDLSGISLVKALSEPPAVIFTTAYPEYAVQGFELEAVDYLVKPISFERFLKAINKLNKQIPLSSSKIKETLVVKADRRIYTLALEDILYVQAYGDYVKIVTDKQTIVPKAKLSDIEKELPEPNFLKAHRSYIIKVKAIEFIEGNQVNIAGQKIPISNKYKNTLLNRL